MDDKTNIFDIIDNFDILSIIIQYIHPNDLLSMTCVSHRFKDVCDDKDIWKYYINKITTKYHQKSIADYSRQIFLKNYHNRYYTFYNLGDKIFKIDMCTKCDHYCNCVSIIKLQLDEIKQVENVYRKQLMAINVISIAVRCQHLGKGSNKNFLIMLYKKFLELIKDPKLIQYSCEIIKYLQRYFIQNSKYQLIQLGLIN